jgi:hypothetical protein
MRSKAVRRAGLCIGVAALTGLPSLAWAQEVRTGLIASTGVSVESNPYNASNSGGVGVSADAEVRPSLSVRDETTQVQMRGSAQLRQFFQRYGLEDNYSFDTSIVSRRSDRVTLRGSGSFGYTAGGYNLYGRPSLIAPDPINSSLNDPVGGVVTPDLTLQNPLNGLTDVNLIGQRTRLTSFGSSLGADFVLSPRSNLSADVNAQGIRYKASSAQDYNTLGGELRFNHSFDELLSVGLIGSYNRTNYFDPSQGDAGVISALLSVDRKFGERWSASVALGASFTNIEGRLGLPATRYNTVTARLRFCRQGEFTRLCVSGSRSPQPAINGNVRVSTNVNADYSVRTSERGRLTLGGSYAQTGRGHTPLVSDPAIDFVSGSARYDNDFNRKMSAFISASISKISSPFAPRRANIGAAIGLQIHLGNPQ